jgi:hypothetical protein
VPHPIVRIEYPTWIDDVADWEHPYATDAEKMHLAITLARENVLRDSGGPFGAESHRDLESRGIEVVRGLMRDEAREILELDRARRGQIYNG